MSPGLAVRTYEGQAVWQRQERLGVLELLKVWTTWLSSFSEWGYQYAKMTFVTSYFLFIQSWNLNYLYLFELLNLNIFWVRSFLNKCFIVWKHNFVVYYIFISIHFCHKVVYVRNSFQVWDLNYLYLNYLFEIFVWMRVVWKIEWEYWFILFIFIFILNMFIIFTKSHFFIQTYKTKRTHNNHILV